MTIVGLVESTDSLTRLGGYQVLIEDMRNNSKIDAYYGEYQFFRIAGAMIALLSDAAAKAKDPKMSEKITTSAVLYITLHRELAEKIAANNDRYLTKHQTLDYIKQRLKGRLDILCIDSDQDFFDLWHLVNTW